MGLIGNSGKPSFAEVVRRAAKLVADAVRLGGGVLLQALAHLLLHLRQVRQHLPDRPLVGRRPRRHFPRRHRRDLDEQCDTAMQNRTVWILSDENDVAVRRHHRGRKPNGRAVLSGV